MNEQLQAAFDKKFKDTWFFEDVPLNHATPPPRAAPSPKPTSSTSPASPANGRPSTWISSIARPTAMTPCWLSTC